MRLLGIPNYTQLPEYTKIHRNIPKQTLLFTRIYSFHTCDNSVITMREISFSDEEDWGLNEGNFLMAGSAVSYLGLHSLLNGISIKNTDRIKKKK